MILKRINKRKTLQAVNCLKMGFNYRICHSFKLLDIRVSLTQQSGKRSRAIFPKRKMFYPLQTGIASAK